MVTQIPPVIGPLVGEKPVTCGGAAAERFTVKNDKTGCFF